MIIYKTLWGSVIKVKDRETLLDNNLNHILGGYENGMCDYPDEFPKLTREEVIDLCIPEIYNQFSDGNGYTAFRKGIADELKFLGNEHILGRIIQIAKECDILKEEDFQVTFDETETNFIKDTFDVDNLKDLHEVVWNCIKLCAERGEGK